MRRLVKILVWVVGLAALAAIVGAAIGMALPESHEATRSALVDARMDDIYPVLITPENYPAWRPDVRSVERLDSDRFREDGANGLMQFKFLDRQPPSRLVVALDDPGQPFTGTWTIELAPEGRQGEWTRVRITERGAVPNPLFRLMARLMMAPTDSIEQYLRNLGRRFNQDVAIDP